MTRAQAETPPLVTSARANPLPNGPLPYRAVAAPVPNPGFGLSVASVDLSAENRRELADSMTRAVLRMD